MARWLLVLLSAILVLMQMSSSSGVYDITILMNNNSGDDDGSSSAGTGGGGSSSRSISSDQSSFLETRKEEEEVLEEETEGGGDLQQDRRETSVLLRWQAPSSSSFTNNNGQPSTNSASSHKMSSLGVEVSNSLPSSSTPTPTSASSTTTSNNNNNIPLEPPPQPIDSTTTTTTTIRKWGCNRNEAPFIFVHIGKAGGGGVRARIAASALDYNRAERWMKPKEDPSYYYPIVDSDGNLHKGKLSHSESPNMLPQFFQKEWDFLFQRTFRFEKSFPCHATTPLGHAIACHMEFDICNKHHPPEGEQDANGGDRCDLVYMGHNVLGGELNFLPTQYLLNWWTNTTWGRSQQQHQQQGGSPNNNNDQNSINVATRLANRYKRSHRIAYPERVNPIRRKCEDGSLKKLFYNKLYEKCIYPETKIADIAALAAVSGVVNNNNNSSSSTTTTTSAAITTTTVVDDKDVDKNHKLLLDNGFNTNWGPLYASMPILRVTMLREPFSWLKSKFFWMNDHMNVKGVPGKVLADRGANTARLKKWYATDKLKREKYKDAEWVKCDDVDNFTKGWGKQGALEYLFYLCGTHCMGQWHAIQEAYGSGDPKLLQEKHLEHLKVMEEQAAYNLRNSFAVVGLLTETPDFYKMISQRVQYMDTSLNPGVRGENHSSGKGIEQQRCSDVFKSESFQKEIMEKGPEIATVVRLYRIGVEVNKFQKEELNQCSPPS